jgi:hypothetical protein
VNALTHACQSSGNVDFEVEVDATLRGGVAPFTLAISRNRLIASRWEMFSCSSKKVISSPSPQPA